MESRSVDRSPSCIKVRTHWNNGCDVVIQPSPAETIPSVPVPYRYSVGGYATRVRKVPTDVHACCVFGHDRVDVVVNTIHGRRAQYIPCGAVPPRNAASGLTASCVETAADIYVWTGYSYSCDFAVYSVGASTAEGTPRSVPGGDMIRHTPSRMQKASSA